VSVPTDPADHQPSNEHVVSVDLAAFLPDGVELAGPGAVPDQDDPARLESPPAPRAPTTAWRPDLEELDAMEADLDAVDEALRALDAGTYGTCRACAQPIPDDLLAAAPARTACAAHA
jgi:hypothetical protein